MANMANTDRRVTLNLTVDQYDFLRHMAADADAKSLGAYIKNVLAARWGDFPADENKWGGGERFAAAKENPQE